MGTTGKIIGRRFKQWRKENGYSQEEIAIELDVEKSYISAIENGRKNVTFKKLDGIITKLKINYNYFFNNPDHN